MYHGIIIAGSPNELGGRNIAGYRLRTSAERYGYKILVIDSAAAMTSDELGNILNNIVTKETLMIGFSTCWLGQTDDIQIKWLNLIFLLQLKLKFNNLKMVIGGADGFKQPGAKQLYAITDWMFTGFSDESFPRLLMLLSGRPDHGLKYMINNDKKRIVDSNLSHQISSPDSIETIFKEEDNFKFYQPMPLEVSRGCIFSCSYCTHPFQGKKEFDAYMRTPENIAQELKRNYDLFGVTRYSIMDDTFNDSIEKIERLEKAISYARLPKFEFVAYIKPELLVTKVGMTDRLVNLGLKGAFFGIESLNNAARKIIGKGLDIQKVLDATYYMSKQDVQIHASLIAGLPNDTVDNLYHSRKFLIENQSTLFKSWIFQPLGIYINGDKKYSSDIDNNPEKYGYEIIDKHKNFASWKNDNMSMEQATSISNNFNSYDRSLMTAAGWQIASMWNINEDNFCNIPLDKLQINSRSKKVIRERAEEVIKKFT